MEVHPPDHAIHTWRDFFTHMGTIVLGLLLALGLEQAAEQWHQARERKEVREALHEDLEKLVRDSANCLDSEKASLTYAAPHYAAVRNSVLTGKPPVMPAVKRGASPAYDLPSLPAWRAAKTGGRVQLLTQNEIKAYSELDLLIDIFDHNSPDLATARRKVSATLSRFPATSASDLGVDYSRATPEESTELLERLTDTIGISQGQYFLASQIHGAAEVMLKGEMDIEKIQQAERPPAPHQ